MAGNVEERTILAVRQECPYTATDSVHTYQHQRCTPFKLCSSTSTCSHAWLQRPLSLPIDEKKVQTLFSQYGRWGPCCLVAD